MPERPHRGATAGEDTTPLARAAVHRAMHTPPTAADRRPGTNLARFAGSAPGRRNRPSEAVRPLLYSRLRAVPHRVDRLPSRPFDPDLPNRGGLSARSCSTTPDQTPGP